MDDLMDEIYYDITERYWDFIESHDTEATFEWFLEQESLDDHEKELLYQWWQEGH